MKKNWAQSDFNIYGTTKNKSNGQSVDQKLATNIILNQPLLNNSNYI